MGWSLYKEDRDSLWGEGGLWHLIVWLQIHHLLAIFICNLGPLIMPISGALRGLKALT